MRKFVINLKRRPDRLEQFFKRCPYPQECIEVIHGFDSKFPKNESSKERKMRSKFKSDITAGPQGCSISHMRVWKKMVNENIPIAMIFEDDAMFNEDFYDFMESLEIPENVNMLFFGGRFNKDFKPPPETMKFLNSKIYQHIIDIWDNRIHERTGHGYILTSKMAKFLLEVFNIKDDNREIDHHIIHTLKELKIPYHSTYPLVCWCPFVSESDSR
jgi:glycosyl transferase family 25